jgi:sarcosine oxidase subunit alpha
VPARRLPAASTNEVERARVPFTFDGRGYEGVWGEPVAVSLLAAGQRTLSRSFRFHRPRGLMCSTGQCGWCECEVDGRPSVRTCRVPLRDDMVVRGEHAWPSVEHDLLGLLDLGSRFVPPTFYHHRFLRPRRLRKAYLDVIRWFGGRGRLGSGASGNARPRVVRAEAPEVLVVGGGRGGLMAAIGAAEAGARVLVLEAEAEDRGAVVPPGTGGLVAEARAAGVDLRFGTAATGWYAGMVTAADDETIWELRPRAVVAATGSYELVPAVPGSDRPGVMGARLAARLGAQHGVLPGERVLLVGGGDELDQVGAALQAAGATVIGPVTTDALRAIGGRGSVASADVLDAAGRPRRERVEVVVFADRTPNLDLVLAAGASVEWREGRLAPQADADGRTSVAGLFVAGDAAGAPAHANAADAASDGNAADAQARQAGRAAAAFADEATGIGAKAGSPTTRTGDPPRSASIGHALAAGSAHSILCFCEDVRGREIQAERTAGYADPELVKRRTGALTGPCQGKYCLSAVTCALNGADPSQLPPDIVLPTARPPLSPVRLGDLVDGEIPATRDQP